MVLVMGGEFLFQVGARNHDYLGKESLTAGIIIA